MLTLDFALDLFQTFYVVYLLVQALIAVWDVLFKCFLKNILKNFNPGVKQLIVLGKALQKTTQSLYKRFLFLYCLHGFVCDGPLKKPIEYNNVSGRNDFMHLVIAEM